MFSLFFLEAREPLTKTFRLNSDGELIKDAYPMISRVWSHEESISNLADFYTALVDHSAAGHCLLKGLINRQLVGESRAGSTSTNDETTWVCLDLDRANWASPEEFIEAYPELHDVSYIVQYSASSGIVDTDKLSCHIFMLLSENVKAPVIKPWLIGMNLYNPIARSEIHLSSSGAALHYSIDITTCQNDKLLYIAPPTLGAGVKCSLPAKKRVQLIKKKYNAIDVSVITNTRADTVREEQRELLNELRTASGRKSLRSQIKWVGDVEIQSKPGEALITGIKEDGDWVRFNLNHGDSWGYYHHKNDFEIIRNFKGEPNYLTKELLPEYYTDCLRERRTQNATPTDGGEQILVFRDFYTDTYYNGIWRPETYELTLAKASSKDRMEDFCANLGVYMPDVVPDWNVVFDPTSDVVVDAENHTLNTFVLSPYMRKTYEKPTETLDKLCPTIYKVILSAVSGNEHNEITEHFLNWLAVLYQTRRKTMTAWVLSGTEGTGKGVLTTHILAPTLGKEYAREKKASDLEDKFNTWLSDSILVVINEMQVGSSKQSQQIMADLKNYITDSWPDVRGMRTEAKQMQNFANFIFTSNFRDPVIITEGDRRYNFGLYQEVKLRLTKKQIEEEIPAELDNWMAYIMTRKADVDAAKSIIENETRETVTNLSRTSIDDVVYYIRQGDLYSLAEDAPDDLDLLADMHGIERVSIASAYTDIIKREVAFCLENINDLDKKAAIYSKLSRDDLSFLIAYVTKNIPDSPKKFSKMLAHKGIPIVPVKHNNTMLRGTNVAWRSTKEQILEMAARFNMKPELKVVPKAEKRAKI